MTSKTRSIACFFLLAACASVDSTTDRRSGPVSLDVREPFELHSRESAAWRAFDSQLRVLHGARITMRSSYDLPGSSPEGTTDIVEGAWEFCLAARRSQLANMRMEEAKNDLDHCRQALEIAEQQLALIGAARDQAQEVVEDALGRLKEDVNTGDKQAKLEDLAAFADALRGYYGNLLRSLSRSF